MLAEPGRIYPQKMLNFNFALAYLRILRSFTKNKFQMKKLTAQEEEAMQVIWRKDGGFTSELRAEMEEKNIPYTTLASTIKNLQRKGYIQGVKYANAYRYEPIIEEEEYKKAFMSGFVNHYFKNSYKELVSFFAKEEKLSTDDLKEIINMIEKEKNH